MFGQLFSTQDDKKQLPSYEDLVWLDVKGSSCSICNNDFQRNEVKSIVVSGKTSSAHDVCWQNQGE